MQQVTKPISREVELSIDNRPAHPHVVTWYPHGVMGVRVKGRGKGTEVFFNIEQAYCRQVVSAAMNRKEG